jgi:hypothetical protein
MLNLGTQIGRLEKRSETAGKTPSNARCFAQGSFMMCWPILESLVGTAHGAEELGLCPHGLACQAGASGHYVGFCLGYGPIWPKNLKCSHRQKIFGEAHNFVAWLDFEKLIFCILIVVRCRCGSRYRGSESRKARYWHSMLTFPIFSWGPLVLSARVVTV